MSDKIYVRGVRASGRHGLPEEREPPQPFDVDVELSADLSGAIASDDLARTIDYALVAREARRVVEEESFTLLESLAEAIAQRVLALGARKVKVRVSKPRAAL